MSSADAPPPPPSSQQQPAASYSSPTANAPPSPLPVVSSSSNATTPPRNHPPMMGDNIINNNYNDMYGGPPPPPPHGQQQWPPYQHPQEYSPPYNAQQRRQPRYGGSNEHLSNQAGSFTSTTSSGVPSPNRNTTAGGMRSGGGGGQLQYSGQPLHAPGVPQFGTPGNPPPPLPPFLGPPPMLRGMIPAPNQIRIPPSSSRNFPPGGVGGPPPPQGPGGIAGVPQRGHGSPMHDSTQRYYNSLRGFVPPQMRRDTLPPGQQQQQKSFLPPQLHPSGMPSSPPTVNPPILPTGSSPTHRFTAPLPSPGGVLQFLMEQGLVRTDSLDNMPTYKTSDSMMMGTPERSSNLSGSRCSTPQSSISLSGSPPQASSSSPTAPPQSSDRIRRIAVDGVKFFDDLLTEVRTKDPTWFLLGPCPAMMHSLIKQEVENFRSNGIRPVFVFNGMLAHGDVESVILTHSEARAREHVWSSIEKHEPIPRKVIDKAFDVTIGEDIEMALIRYMAAELDVEVFRAPFLSVGQMVSFLLPANGKYVDDVLGSPDLLMFQPVSRVILSIDWDSRTFVFADKAEVAGRLFPEAFIERPDHDTAFRLLTDFLLLASSCKSMSNLRLGYESMPPTSIWRLMVEAHKNGERICDMVMNSVDDPREANTTVWRFMKARSFVKHCEVLVSGTADNPVGEIMPLSKLVDQQAPQNLTSVFGSRVPTMLYFFQFIGLVGPGTMTTLTQNYLRDDNPIADSVQCRNVMETVVSLRTQVLFQLLQYLQLNQAYSLRVKVSWIRAYEPISVAVRRPPDIRLAHWNVVDIEGDDLFPLCFRDVVKYSMRGTVSPDITYTNLNQILMVVGLKSLDLLGYFTHASLVPDPDMDQEASGMSCYSETILALQNPTYVPHCVLLIELLRTRSLTLSNMTYITDANFRNPESLEVNGMEEDTPTPCESVVPLAARISCLFHIECKPVPWTAGYDRHVSTFHVMVRNMYKTLRTMTEVIAVSTWIDNSSQLPIDQYCKLPALLPFNEPPSCAAALITVYLVNSPDDFGCHCTTPEDRLQHLKEKFAVVSDLETSLKGLFEYWEEAYIVFNELYARDSQTVGEELVQAITMAVALMRAKRDAIFGALPPSVLITPVITPPESPVSES